MISIQGRQITMISIQGRQITACIQGKPKMLLSDQGRQTTMHNIQGRQIIMLRPKINNFVSGDMRGEKKVGRSREL